MGRPCPASGSRLHRWLVAGDLGDDFHGGRIAARRLGNARPVQRVSGQPSGVRPAGRLGLVPRYGRPGDRRRARDRPGPVDHVGRRGSDPRALRDPGHRACRVAPRGVVLLVLVRLRPLQWPVRLRSGRPDRRLLLLGLGCLVQPERRNAGQRSTAQCRDRRDHRRHHRVRAVRDLHDRHEPSRCLPRPSRTTLATYLPCSASLSGTGPAAS